MVRSLQDLMKPIDNAHVDSIPLHIDDSAIQPGCGHWIARSNDRPDVRIHRAAFRNGCCNTGLAGPGWVPTRVAVAMSEFRG
jgi:hypothetical protein